MNLINNLLRSIYNALLLVWYRIFLILWASIEKQARCMITSVLVLQRFIIERRTI